MAGEGTFEPSEQGLELLLSPDEGPSRWLGRGSVVARGMIEHRFLAQDRLLELPQLPAGLDPQLLDESTPEVAIGRERLGLAARPVERQHQSAPGPLAKGMLAGQGLELANDLGVSSQGELRVDPIFHGGEAMLLQTGDVRLQGCFEAQVRQRRPLPQGERVPQAPRGPLGIAGPRQGSGLGRAPLEAM